MKKDLEKLQEIYGEVQTLVTPSGHEVTLRMQTGADDDILSNAKEALDGSSSVKFISGIVVHTDITENGKMNLDTARDLKLCDRYFILIASRIFSIGQTVKFKYQWPDNFEVDYEEDLGLFIWDYHNPDNPFPEKGHPEYFRERIKPHQGGKSTHREFTIKSKKKLRYVYMNGHSEKWLMQLPEENQTVNSSIIARGLEQEVDGKWVKVQNFKNFNPQEMREIRNDILDNDPPINLVTELEHPSTHGIVEYPIVASTDFFFPREI